MKAARSCLAAIHASGLSRAPAVNRVVTRSNLFSLSAFRKTSKITLNKDVLMHARYVHTARTMYQGDSGTQDGAQDGGALAVERPGDGAIRKMDRLAVPLPSMGQTLFALSPGTTVAQFVKDIESEDTSVTNVRLFEEEGTAAIAGSTLIRNVLFAPSFKLLVNERMYAVSTGRDGSESGEEGVEGGTGEARDMEEMVAHLCSSLERLESSQVQRADLRRQIVEWEERLAPMEALREECQITARKSARRLAWVGLGAMGLQFGFLARLTWWDFSWDIMEPVTYFITYATQMMFLGYFVLTQREYDYETLHQRKELKVFYKQAARKNLDVSQYNKLKQNIARTEEELKML